MTVFLNYFPAERATSFFQNEKAMNKKLNFELIVSYLIDYWRFLGANTLAYYLGRDRDRLL